MSRRKMSHDFYPLQICNKSNSTLEHSYKKIVPGISNKNCILTPTEFSQPFLCPIISTCTDYIYVKNLSCKPQSFVQIL